jgi:hypothetical protein
MKSKNKNLFKSSVFIIIYFFQILEKNKELKNEDLYELSKLLFRSYAKPSWWMW